MSSPAPGNLKKDAVYVYGGYFLRYLSIIVLVPYYGRILGPASYGKVLAAMSLSVIVWTVVNYGFNMTGVRELAMAKDEASYGHIFGRQLMARLMLVPVGIVIGVIGTFGSPALSSEPLFGVMATLIGIANAMNLGWFFQGIRKFRLSIIFDALVYPLNILLVLWLVKTPEDGLYVLIAYLATAAVCTLSAYIVALRHLKKIRIVFAGGAREVKDASILFLQSFNSMLMTAGSTYLLSVLSSPEQVGFFGSSEKLVSFTLALLYPAGQILMPTITHRSAHAPQYVRSLIRKAVFLQLGYGICAAVGGVILAPYIIPLAFGARFEAGIPLMKTLVLFLPFAALTHAIGWYILIPQKKEKWLVVGISIGNVLNFILIALFAHDYGGMGVSIARVAGECVTALILMILIMRMKKGRFVLRDDAAEVAKEILPES